MNQSLILVFILLATLSVVNTLPHQLSKRETQWGQCIYSGVTYPPLNITISPDPLVQGQDGTFSVFGDFEAGATDILYISFYKDLTKNPLHVFKTFVCGVKGLPNCPVKPFKMNCDIKVPKGLPNPYFIVVIIGDQKAQKTLGCGITFVSGGSEESYPIASYSIASYPIASYPIASYPIAE
ncbi:hypothetical protein Glove_365g10 [Diversispora epigaea]|uniref:MD-2-related lipid-recognition domain-containing protein n=1 Tax=Diversispora epigaea TaxID=1348612 RepID=A0A397H8T2_9GLOM|nr:hypothetical protein Glove_365g10 [Diversispora epigaea]